jgi:hypothetical protein
MHRAHHRRILLGVLLALGTSVIALTGCTRVLDTTTGISLNRNKPEKCIKACNESFHALQVAELARHHQEIEACLALTRPDRGACLAAEGARHAAAMAEIIRARRDCKNGCHNQGGGSGG